MTKTTEALIKHLTLNVSAEKAFRFFTENIDKWWPLASHSLGQEEAQSVVFEGREQGRIYEISKNGAQRDWGVVLKYVPYSKLVFSWVLEAPDDATEVEVNFSPESPTSCRLTLIHRGWDQRSDGAKWRANYNQGWDGVLGLFEAGISKA